MSETVEILDAEVIDEPSVASLAPAVRPTSALVEPAASTDQIESAFRAYQDLCNRLLTKDDYQQIGDRSFRKKSAWRKLAVAFGVSCEITNRDYERNDAGRIIRSEVVVRATAPNGRYMDGVGACDAFERCCPTPCPRARYNKHTCCVVGCSGGRHFSNPQHDIPATAATRATNRACADLFGMGEVSAEEIVGDAPTSAAENGHPYRQATLRADVTPVDVGRMRMAELRDRLLAADLSPNGTLAELRERLAEYVDRSSAATKNASQPPPGERGAPSATDAAGVPSTPGSPTDPGSLAGVCAVCAQPIPLGDDVDPGEAGVETEDGRLIHAGCAA